MNSSDTKLEKRQLVNALAEEASSILFEGEEMADRDITEAEIARVQTLLDSATIISQKYGLKNFCVLYGFLGYEPSAGILRKSAQGKGR